MVNVKNSYNILNIIKKLPLKPGVDYFYFLDSTLARFWFATDSAKQIIKKTITNNEFGEWINQKERTYYNINYGHNKFGDEIWWASGGTLIKPNFWQGNSFIKGMHGYRDTVDDNHTMIFGDINFKTNNKKIDMTTVHSILMNFLELK